MKKRHKAVVYAVVVVAALGGSAAAAPHYARYKAEEWARGRGLVLKAGDVSIHPGSVRLKEVQITSPFFPGQEVSLNSIEVELSGMKVKVVQAEGGSISLNGRAKDLERMYQGWPGRGNGRGNGGPGIKKSVHGIKVVWKGPDGGNSEVAAAGVSWENGKAHAELVTTKSGKREVRLSGLDLWKEKDGYEITVKDAEVKIPERREERRETEGAGFRMPAVPAMKSPVRVRAKRAIAEIGKRKAEAEDLIASMSGMPGGIAASVSAKHLEIPGRIRLIKFGAEAKIRTDGLSGKAWFGSIGTSHRALTNSEIETGRVEISGDARLMDSGTQAVADIHIGKATVHAEAEVGRAEVQLRSEMDESDCQDVLDSVPRALVRTITPGARLSGKLSWKIQVDVDLPDRKKPDVRIKLKNGCSVENLPDGISVKSLRRPFVRKALGYDKKEREVRTGPGSPEWVPIQLVSRFVPMSLKTMEDPGFNGHHGFLVEAFENALKADIHEGRFARGGSTITMQLAKNLWLGREKTLSRKLQEAVLTTYLEQELSKEKILELYMNVVEFGPGVYGIKAAAKKYFNAEPMQLSLSQSLLLASVLPRPNGAYFGPNGAVTPGRMALLHRIMKAMLDTQRISEDEYREGLRESPREGTPETAVGPSDKIEADPEGLDPGSWQTD